MNPTALFQNDFMLRPLLIVEDNEMDLDFYLQAFSEHGIVNPIIICRDGDEAVHFIDAHPVPEDPQLPLLTLLDLRLPKVDGIDVLRYAQHHPVWKMIPFIVLTTSREESDILHAYESGTNSYLVKPVDFNSFLELMQNIKKYWLSISEPPFSIQTIETL